MKPRCGWGRESETSGRKPQVGNNAITTEAATHVVKRGKPRAGQGDIVGELKGSKNSIQIYTGVFRKVWVERIVWCDSWLGNR